MIMSKSFKNFIYFIISRISLNVKEKSEYEQKNF